ncbi:hypothetical protein OG883_44560 [Streptomyces sp. NBC_01142]|uniref:hypothetical protein n=1 Tax=Streptomyces sp. NBC_01142 TaxID=2975865 RepID=UPI00225B5DEF|nr:hypothetical protein [Streptomyces sp. NBC_01142]MCX4826718.1 hypothetical protein [Streptomyces sp. NBC_01142]
MALPWTRTNHRLADAYSGADIARLTGLTRGRVSQLRSADESDALPEPDAPGSTPTRPLWRGDTVARWCARTGRRLPPCTASWLMPGPDGPHLRRESQRTLRLQQDDLPDNPDLRRPPIDVHVARYTAAGDSGPSVWLVTVLAPGEMRRLLGWPHGWPHGSPLDHLVREILADFEPDHRADTDLLGTLVLLPTIAEPEYGSMSGDVRMLQLHKDDVGDRDADRLHGRLRQLRPSADELRDLAQALGHRLPWWPPGCATPALVSSWAPDALRPPEHVPPPLAGAQAFLRRCESAAAELHGSLRDSVLELGRHRWNRATSGWRGDVFPDHGALPKDCDPEIWQVAVEFNLPPVSATSGDFDEGLEWVMDHAPSQRLARDAERTFGDPGSSGTVLINTNSLPSQLRSLFTNHVTSAVASGSYRAQRVLDALDAHPGAAAGALLGTWPAITGPAWCATSPGTGLVALHVPRVMPAHASSAGAPLEVVLLRTEPVGSYGQPAPAIGFVITEQDQVLLLPAQGRPVDLAAAIEHAVWHPDVPTPLHGLAPSSNESLVTAVDALVETGPRVTPWEQLTALVAPPPRNGSYFSCCGVAAGPAEGKIESRA